MIEEKITTHEALLAIEKLKNYICNFEDCENPMLDINFDKEIIIKCVRSCKPSDLTYTIELEKQKLNSFEKFIRLKTN